MAGICYYAAAHATSRIIAAAMARVAVEPEPALCAPYAFLSPRLDNIPDELKAKARWVVWRGEGPLGQKPKKMPYRVQPNAARLAGEV